MIVAARALFTSGLALAIVSFIPTSALAQDTQPEDLPIGRYVADVRVQFPKFKQDPTISNALGVATESLPTRGFGYVLGAHWYPLRLGIVTLGVGAEISKAGTDKTKN